MLKQIRGLAALVAFVVGTMLAVSLWASFETQPSTENNYTAHAASNQREDHLFPGIPYDGWTALFTLVLGVSTIGLWIVTGMVASTAKKALTRLERPWMIVSDFEIFVVDEKRRGVKMQIKNIGRSPAIIKSYMGGGFGAPPKAPFDPGSPWP